MSRSKANRIERIELRAKPEVKAIIERAAELQHTTVSAYVLETAFHRAQAELKETETLVLNEEDRSRFFTLIASPPQQNPALRALFRKPRR